MRTSPILDFLALLLSLLVLIAPAVAQDTKAIRLVKAFQADRTFFGQFEVAKEIVALHDSSVLSQLEPHLKEEDRLVRGNAAFIFAALGDDRGFDVICDILKDRSQRRAGQGVATACKSPSGCVKQEIRQDRYYAAHLLGDLKQPRAVPILVPLLKDSDVQYIVPRSLAQIGDHDAVAPLIETLHDPNPDMRWLAVNALATLKAKEALPQLREMQGDDARIHFDRPRFGRE
jgi:HEAT repeat protein